MNIVSIVIDKNNTPYGLELDTKEIVLLKDFIENPIKNKQIEIVDDKLIEQKGFKFKEIPMKQLLNKNLINISNELILNKRIIMDSNLVGFEVSFNSKVLNLTLKELYSLAKFCHCTNFILKTNSRHTYIVGKGIKLKDLPSTETIDKAPSIIKKKEVLDLEKDFDVLDIFDFLKTIDAQIIKLPTEKYTKTKNNSKKVSNEFIDLGIGELTSPSIRFTETNINVNATFKKYGNVLVEFDGNKFNLQTYVLSTKHIYFNGENYLNEIGIILDKDKEESLVNFLSKTLSLKKIQNDLILNPLKSILNKRDIILYAIDTSKIEFIKSEKLKDFEFNEYKIKKYCLDLIYLKTTKRYLNFMKKETEEKIKELKLDIPKPKIGIYSSFNDEMIDFLKDSIGIDIHTGMFKKIEDDKVKNDEISDIEIVYSVKGFKSIPSSKDIVTKSQKSLKFISKNLEIIMNDIESESDYTKKFTKIEEYINKNNNEILNIVEKLWKHKLNSFINGNKLYYKDNWNYQLIKESAEYKEYSAISESDLYLKLRNIDI